MVENNKSFVSKFRGMRVALYIRVSTLEQVVMGGSLAMQEDSLLAWAKENGCIVAGTYIDDGHTATTLKRPALQRMLGESDSFDLVIFIKLDRFSRGVKNYYKIMERLDETGTLWHAIFEDHDTTTANGRMMINLVLTIAENEAAMTSERTKAVNKHKALNGECTFSVAPHGYKIDKSDGRRRLALDEDSARYVRAAYEHYSKFASIRLTQHYIADEYGVKMAHDTTRKLLTNKLYIGIYEHAEAGDIEDYCPPIIDRAKFYEVQRALAKNAKLYPRKHKHTYIYSGMLICHKCGRRMSGGIGRSGKNGYRKYYRCPSSNQTGSCSNSYPMPEKKLERYLMDNVRALLEDRIITYTVEQGNAENREVASIKAKIEKTKKRMSRLKELYLDEEIDRDEYSADYKKYDAELKDLSKRLQIEETKVEHFDIELYKSFLQQDFETIYKTLEDADKRRVWLSVIDTIEVGKERIEPKFF